MKHAFAAGVLVATVVAAAAVRAGPVDWLRSKLSQPAQAVTSTQISDGTEGSVPLEVGELVHVHFDEGTPRGELPGGESHYRRFTLSKPLAHALVKVQVLTQHHDQGPRYTAFAPRIYVLDGNGEIRDTHSVQPLSLSIRPFRRAELHGCLRVENLQSFLIAADTARVGKVYEFNARPREASKGDNGFYRGTATMNVYLPFAGTGELILRVQRGGPGHHC